MGTVFYLVLEVLSAWDLRGFAYCGLFLFFPPTFHYLTHFSSGGINFWLKTFHQNCPFSSFLTFSRHSASLFPDFYSPVYCHLPKNLSYFCSDDYWYIFNSLPLPCFYHYICRCSSGWSYMHTVSNVVREYFVFWLPKKVPSND